MLYRTYDDMILHLMYLYGIFHSLIHAPFYGTSRPFPDKTGTTPGHRPPPRVPYPQGLYAVRSKSPCQRSKTPSQRRFAGWDPFGARIEPQYHENRYLDSLIYKTNRIRYIFLSGDRSKREPGRTGGGVMGNRAACMRNYPYGVPILWKGEQ